MELIEQEAEIIREKLKVDLLAAYGDLRTFFSIYGKTPEIEQEVVLLGSSISAVIMSVSDANEKAATITLLKEQANKIIDHIITDFLNKKVVNYANVNSNDEKPEISVVFAAKKVIKKVSRYFDIKEISFEIKLGEITSIIGENGTGKTTLLNIIAGEITIDKGEIVYPLFNMNPKLNWRQIKGNIAYLHQNIHPWDNNITLKKQLQLFAAVKGIKGKDNEYAYNNLAARLDLKKFENNYWNDISGGYKLRFELAKQIIWRPKLLVLDEPLASLDIISQMQFLNDLRSLANSISHSMGIILSSQNIYEVERVSDNIIFLNKGETIYNGPKADIGKHADTKCYEMFTGSEVYELLGTSDYIKEIKDNSFNMMIYTDNDVFKGALLGSLTKAGVDIKYFRDVTNSSRIFFEK